MLVDSPDLMVRINFSSVYICTNSIFVELLFTAVQMPACSVVYTLVCVKLIGFNISNIVCTLCIALFYIVVLFFLRCDHSFSFQAMVTEYWYYLVSGGILLVLIIVILTVTAYRCHRYVYVYFVCRFCCALLVLYGINSWQQMLCNSQNYSVECIQTQFICFN